MKGERNEQIKNSKYIFVNHQNQINFKALNYWFDLKKKKILIWAKILIYQKHKTSLNPVAPEPVIGSFRQIEDFM